MPAVYGCVGMRGNTWDGNGIFSSISIPKEHGVLEPLQAPTYLRNSICNPRSKDGSERPQHTLSFGSYFCFKGFCIIRPQRFIVTIYHPFSNSFTLNQRS